MDKNRTVDRNELESVRKERDILVRLQNSEWVAKLLMSFQDAGSLYFAMEYCAGGDLRSFMANCGPLDEDEAKFYLSEMVAAVRDLHGLGYIHRDLKPGNFVIEQSGHLKLIDFGLSAEGINARLNQGYSSMANNVRQSISMGKSPYGSLASIRERRETRKERRFSMVGSPGKSNAKKLFLFYFISLLLLLLFFFNFFFLFYI